MPPDGNSDPQEQMQKSEMRTGRLGLPTKGHWIALMSKYTYYITKAKSRHLTDGLEGIKSEKICEGRGLLRSFRKNE